MKKIASFEVDHTLLRKGMYLSRVDGDCVTYDIRTRRPNIVPAMETGTIHTLEHMIATFVRNSEFSDQVVYFGPMGCRTGFYFIVRNTVMPREAIELIRQAFAYCAAYGTEPQGISEKECGNWKDHDLKGAKHEAYEMSKVLADWTPEKLIYPVGNESENS